MAQAHPILDKSGFNPDKKLKIVGSSPVKHDGLDKVTGRAKFGADMFLPGMLVGKILRSPHPHAIIKSIDTSAAEKLPGVKAVICRADFPEIKAGTADGDMTRNAMAREKALYDGHPVAAVAATSESIAKAALKLIKVDYEPLPHVIDPVEAMKPDAPILHDHVRTKGVKGADKPSNVIERLELNMGDAEAGFAEADVIVEREFDTKPMHQGYIEPQACVASTTEDGQIELWCCTQAPWVFRDRLSNILKIETAKIRVQQSEMGGGFGGKTGFYPEPIAIQLSRKAKRPVKIMLTRNEVFRATGPVSGTKSRIKIGCKKDGTITAAEAELFFQTGCFTGSAFTNAPQAMFTRYALKNVKTTSYEIVSNRPKVNSFRAPCVPQIVFGVEGVISELAAKIGMDGIDFRLKNAAVEGYKTIYGDVFGPIGFVQTLEAAKKCDHYTSPVPEGCGRGIAAGFWFNRGGETTGTLEHRHRRFGDAHSRHHRRRGLAHLHLDDGGRGARHPGRQGACRHGRHPLARLQPRHRGLAHHLLHRHGDRRFRAQGDQRAVPARRRYLGRAGGRRHLRGRLLQAGELRTSAASSRCRSPRSQPRPWRRTAPSPDIRR